MKNLIKKIVAGMSAAAVLIFGSSLPIPKAENFSAWIVANAALGEAENFLGTGTDSSGVTIYNTNSKYSFNMNGRSCYQGIVFDDSKSTAQITYDISDIDTLSFTIGHVDNTSNGNATAKFYLDGDEYDSFTMYWTMPLMEYELDCSFADSLQIIIERDGASSYAFTDVTVDGISAARPSKAPEYKSAEDFLNQSFAGVNVREGNVDSREPDFYMNGRGYYQGIIFESTNVSREVDFNVENVDTVSFTIGHIDNDDGNNATMRFYLDDKEYDSVNLYWNMNLVDYTLDVTDAKTIRIVVERSGAYGENSCYAFADVSVDNYEPEKKHTIAEYDTVEGFLKSGHDSSNISVANPKAVEPQFNMNGRNYFQGLVFTNTNQNADVSYNVENLKSLSFTIGHIDNSGTSNATAVFYLDEKKYDSVDLFWTMPLQQYVLDVSEAKVLRIVIQRSGAYGENSSYAFAEFAVDKIQPSKYHVVPQYGTPYEFINSGFATSGIWIPNIEAKEPEYYINEKGYYQGLVFSNSNQSASVCYNVENLDSVSFTIGHVDGSGSGKAKFTFYLDNKKYNEVSLTSDMEPLEYTIECPETTVLKINITRSGAYADNSGYVLADVSIVPKDLKGDCNNDGSFTIADAILLQKWLLAVSNTKLADWESADFCEDGNLNIFDLAMMKCKLVNV